MTLFQQNKLYLEQFDALMREMDEIIATPMIRIPRRIASPPVLSNVDVWLDQFVALLAVRP